MTGHITYTHEPDCGPCVTFRLDYRITAGCPERYSSWTGWSPAETDECEITGAVVVDIDEREPTDDEAQHWSSWFAQQMESKDFAALIDERCFADANEQATEMEAGRGDD